MVLITAQLFGPNKAVLYFLVLCVKYDPMKIALNAIFAPV